MYRVPQFMPFVSDEEYQSIKGCFDRNWLTEGVKTKEFNDKLCKLMGVKYGVFAPNGTLALYLGLKAIGIGPGDEVIVPAFTFIGSANAVVMTGAIPVFVDVNIEDFHINIQACEGVVTRNTKAIMPVHIYGCAANMDDVVQFAKKHKLKIIEDAAQALGVHWNGKHCGTFGDVGCFSFFADKTVTTGEGGFIVTNNEEYYHSLKFLRNQGRLERGTFIHPEIGYNFRLTDIQSSIGLTQLSKLDEIIKKKRQVYEIYKELLSGNNRLNIIGPQNRSSHIPFRVVALGEKAHDLMSYLKAHSIEPRTFFYPLYKQPCYTELAEKEQWVRRLEDKYFPNSFHIYNQGICLPTYAALERFQIEYVCDMINQFYDECHA